MVPSLFTPYAGWSVLSLFTSSIWPMGLIQRIGQMQWGIRLGHGNSLAQPGSGCAATAGMALIWPHSNSLAQAQSSCVGLGNWQQIQIGSVNCHCPHNAKFPNPCQMLWLHGPGFEHPCWWPSPQTLAALLNCQMRSTPPCSAPCPPLTTVCLECTWLCKASAQEVH